MHSRIMILLITTAFLTQPAHAGFNVISESNQGTTSSLTKQPEVRKTIKRRSPKITVQKKTKSVHSKQVAVKPVAVGFGNAVPLEFALRQIIPRSIAVSFDPRVDVSTPVNWQGGREWMAVLEDTLKSVDLKAKLQGTELIITL